MINAIFAIDNNGGMGSRGSLPWPHDSEDMRWFQRHNKNQIVVMGSATWLDPNMPSPLPNRINVVVSRKHLEDFPGADYVMNVNELDWGFKLIAQDYPDKTIWIIGGPRLLTISRNFIETAIVTHYNSDYGCDAILDTKSWFTNTEIQDESPGINKIFRKYKCKPI